MVVVVAMCLASPESPVFVVAVLRCMRFCGALWRRWRRQRFCGLGTNNIRRRRVGVVGVVGVEGRQMVPRFTPVPAAFNKLHLMSREVAGMMLPPAAENIPNTCRLCFLFLIRLLFLGNFADVNDISATVEENTCIRCGLNLPLIIKPLPPPRPFVLGGVDGLILVLFVC